MEDGSVWELWERDGELSLQHDGLPCASSFTHGSEESMAEMATAPITLKQAGTMLPATAAARPCADA